MLTQQGRAKMGTNGSRWIDRCDNLKGELRHTHGNGEDYHHMKVIGFAHIVLNVLPQHTPQCMAIVA